ncbi:unnamed protein product, partial [Laminaria digitata]
RVDSQSQRKVTPIMLAALKGHVEVVRLLVHYYRDGKPKCTALHCAAAGGHVRVVELLLGGAFLDWQDRIGTTPLYRAVYFGHDTISRTLLKAGADPNLSDKNGTGPLHVAAYAGCGQMVADLLEAG